jgi:hypothetical protein
MALRIQSRQSIRDRGKLRRHLRDLEESRDQLLRDLGGLTLEMYKQDRFEGKLLWAKAAEVAALDDETKLVARGLEEGVPLEELQRIAHSEAVKADKG